MQTLSSGGYGDTCNYDNDCSSGLACCNESYYDYTSSYSYHNVCDDKGSSNCINSMPDGSTILALVVFYWIAGILCCIACIVGGIRFCTRPRGSKTFVTKTINNHQPMLQSTSSTNETVVNLGQPQQYNPNPNGYSQIPGELIDVISLLRRRTANLLHL